MGSLALAAAVGSTAFASDLDLRIESSGQTSITVRPGEILSYDVVGELTDNLNDGLALVLFDLSFDGGDLAQASAPAGAPMLSFDRPNGITNPAGFGGTVQSGDLIQVGGAQNSINSSFAPFPNGVLTTGVAAQGFPETLVSGSLTAPLQFGTYTLSATNLVANVVRSGETGFPFWRVEEAGPGSVTNLTIEVVSLATPTASISLSAGGSQSLFVDGGQVNAGELYWLLTGASGSSPGFVVAPNSLPVPLNVDALVLFMVGHPSPPAWVNNLAFLDGTGQNTAMFNVPAGVDPGLAGITLTHAFSLIDPVIHLTSNHVDLALLP
jgi:hypothetical protein